MLRAVARGGLHDPVAAQVETTLFRALAVLRFVVAAYVVVLNALRWREFDRPVLGWTVVAMIVVWSVVAAWAYDAPRRRGLPLLVVDLLVATLALLSTPLVESDAMLARNASTLPSFWVIGAVLAWAVMLGWPGDWRRRRSSRRSTCRSAPARPARPGGTSSCSSWPRGWWATHRPDPGGHRGAGAGREGGRGARRAGPAGAGGARRGAPGAGARAAPGRRAGR